MKKRIWLGAVLALVLAAFAACGTPVEEEDVKEAVTVPEDFQLAGSWMDENSQRAVMTIEEEGGDKYSVEVSWSSGADQTTVWTFSGEFKREGGFLYFTDGKKAELTTDEQGRTAEEVKYEDGSGVITYRDGALYWQDDKEAAGDECKFVRAE